MVRLIPRDEKFYDMFAELEKRMTTSAELLRQLFAARPGEIESICSRIKVVEHEADRLVHDVVKRIDTTFVTPFDREDIHMLASQLDNVVDLIDGTARRAVMFHIREVREPAHRLTGILVRATDALSRMVVGMKDHKLVVRVAGEVKTLEEEGDAVYHEAVGGLFATDGIDAIEVFKWKELYDTIERSLDQCDHVANVISSISLKNS